VEGERADPKPTGLGHSRGEPGQRRDEPGRRRDEPGRRRGGSGQRRDEPGRRRDEIGRRRGGSGQRKDGPGRKRGRVWIYRKHKEINFKTQIVFSLIEKGGRRQRIANQTGNT